MPSLVNFQPLIDASKERARATQRAAEIRTAGMERGFVQAGQALDIMGQRGRQREKEFHSIFDFDLNKNANKFTRGYLANKYSQIKRDGVNAFKGNKNFLGYGKLTPEQRIQIDDELDSLKKEAELLNVINMEIDNAEKLNAQKKHILVDNEAVGEYLQLLKPNQSGQYDTEGMAEFLSRANASETGQPFTYYANFDADMHLNQSRSIIKKGLPPEKFDETIAVDRGGKRVTEKYETTTYGTEDQRRNAYYSMLTNSDTQDWYENQIGKKLTDDERETAIAQYGNKVANPFSAYYAFDKADMTTGFEDRKRLKFTGERPLSKTERGVGTGTEPTYIEEDNGTWRLGTTPVSIKFDVAGEPQAGQVVEVHKDDDGYMTAKVQHKDEFGEYVYTDLPLEKYYDELDRAFKRYSKGGLQLEGWEEMTEFGAEPPAPPEPVPEFDTRYEWRWDVEDKQEYRDAVKWLKENPSHQKSQQVYDRLKSQNVIK